jgi:hypothetical protein
MKELRWHEPPGYRRARYFEDLRRNLLHSAGTAVTAFLVVIVIRYAAGLEVHSRVPSWPRSLAFAAGISLLVSFALPAILSLLPSSFVILSHKGINNNLLTRRRGWFIRFWPWDEIECCSVHPVTLGGSTYDILGIHATGGNILAELALPRTPSHGELEAYLAAHGKRLTG